MTRELANKMLEAMLELDIEAEVVEEYSGRGMFGKATTGVVVRGGRPEEGGLMAVAFILGTNTDAENDRWEMAEEVYKLRVDSMGHDMIIY